MLTITGYETTDLIYDGTRTQVYRGLKTEDSKPIVLKKLRKEYPTFNELLQFRHQYVLTKNLDLPGIVKPLALEKEGNGYLLVMEDVGGVSLSEYISDRPLAIEEFLPVAIALTEILGDLYRNRVIHKDIKPANILINPETQEIHLIDFSISSLLPRETQEIQNPNVLEGTLAYISPEQTGRMNRGIDYRSDFYSLGVTFYELLTGELPFTSDDPMELVHCHIAREPVPPHAVKPEIPKALSEIVMKLMAKTAEERYQSALGIKYDLEKCWQQWQETGSITELKLGERDQSDRFIIPEKLYGRETEVQVLLDAFDRVASGQSEMMLVAGFSGIGKTAVVNEVHKPIVEKRGYFIKGKYDQFNRNIPFSAFVQAFRDLMGQLLSESDVELASWKDKILEAVGDSAQVLIDVIPELEHVIGEQSPVPELSGSAAQNRFNLLFQKFISVFTTPKHPLVMFLDDLQWADLASLNLMKVLMGDSNTGYLLLLGAYRDNEVFPAHPLMLALAELEKVRAVISTITLEPLYLKKINELIAETLGCESHLARPLTELVYQKTKGNPFFTTQFLQGLYEDGLIYFNSSLSCWECDLVKVQDAALTDDVVEFMAARLQKLSPATQKNLTLAACIGNQFDLEMLAITCEESEEKVSLDIWSALREGLVVPLSQNYKFFQGEGDDLKGWGEIAVGYRFLHDRVQQAAYSLINDNQKQSVHLKIGQLLLAHQSSTESEDNIFKILNHLMIGINAAPSAIPGIHLAELALSAGRKAKLSVAYQSAIDYFRFGLSWLPQDAWSTEYQLTFDLNREKAECDYFTGKFEESELILNHILTKVTNPIDAARIYGILMTQRTTQGTDILSGVDAGIKGLAVLGMKLPTKIVELESLVDEELEQVQEAFERVSPQFLLELPEMSDPVQQSCMKLLSILWSTSYVAGNPTLNWLTTLRMMNLSLKYGRAQSSSFSYCSYGMVLAYRGQYQEAYEFGRVALEVDRRCQNTQFIAKNNNHFCHAIAPYIRSLAENLPLYQEAFEICTELGDLIFGVWAIAFIIWTHILKGSQLSFINGEIQKYIGYVRGVNDKNMLYAFELKQHFVQELMDATNENSLLTYQSFLNNPLIEEWRKSDYGHGINWYGFLVLQRLYLQGNYTQVVEVSQSLKSTLPANFGFFPVIIYHIYYPLSLTAIYSEANSTNQGIYWQEIQEQRQLLQTWSQTCPHTFLHKYQLILAEISRLNGDYWQASEHYDEAIAGAKENKYIQEEALANELAAKFYLNLGKEKIAAGYMQEAYYCYAKWGAKAKVADLEKRYRQLLAPILQQTRSPLSTRETIANLGSITSTVSRTSSSSVSAALDLAAILKANQTLSSEIELEKLLSSLLSIVIENAGADKCVLMLLRDDRLLIKGLITLGTEPVVLQRIPVEESQDIPLRLIYKVKHNRQTVVLTDATAELTLANDPYIEQYQPKSILCSPILHQGKLMGILYLENNLTTGAFTRDRIELLNLLCAQAAISLENARLYQQAQQALTDLQQAQLQIIQSEKMSALGNLVSGIGHEMNNPLGFICATIQQTKLFVTDIIEHLNIYQKSLPQKNDEIVEHSAEIDLNYTLEDLPKMIDAMDIACERLKNISTSLRTFSRADRDYKVPFNIHEGIDSTILILKHRLKASVNRQEIEVVKNYGSLPEINCYPGQLNQVFMNLLANAIDALEEAKSGDSFEEMKSQANRIAITTEIDEEKQNAIVRIEDNGPGMPEEIKEKIFEHLFTTKEVGKGTGLGLSISRQIVVEKHGGKISLISAEGKGTEFCIAIPL